MLLEDAWFVLFFFILPNDNTSPDRQSATLAFLGDFHMAGISCTARSADALRARMFTSSFIVSYATT